MAILSELPEASLCSKVPAHPPKRRLGSFGITQSRVDETAFALPTPRLHEVENCSCNLEPAVGNLQNDVRRWEPMHVSRYLVMCMPVCECVCTSIRNKVFAGIGKPTVDDMSGH